MKSCRACKHQVSEQAASCPGCGAPYPARERWDGYGFEYKSQFTIAGYALAQFALAYSCIAQFAVYADQGVGQVLVKWADLLGRF